MILVRTTVKNVKKVSDNLTKKIVGAVASDPKLKTITEDFKKTIRSGRLLDGTAIKSLAPTTVAFRRRYARVNPTGKGYRPNKSNLTFTGQFIESFKTSVERFRNKVSLKIAPTGIHKGIKLIRGGKAKGVSNQVLAQHIIDGGRDFTIIGKQKQKFITRVILEIIKRALRKV